ncbi:MAG: 16S rRNA (guanine(527)-N(7))-methyltransferase RsmG [Bacilli bacterium]|nr:16S rRNA (guanine(527)-N(7))-methyltransferase RsmG [Bacilli bacterium]
MNKEEFLIETKKMGLDITVEQLDLLDRFYNLLIEWNKKINLTTITSYEEVYLKHFFDSLTLYKEVNLNETLYLCDVGTGAGFPGIVLKICFPKLNITLVDSLQKRVNYLNTIIEELNLADIRAYHVRMEDFSKLNEEKFDIITARAVANMNTLLEISIKSLKINGRLILMKANCEEEISNCKKALKELSCELVNVKKFTLPKENSNRTLINIKKTSKTKEKYPRTIDKIKKNPL